MHSGVPMKPVVKKENQPVKKEDNRPNVLFIAIDDLRPNLGTYDNQTITPNIDRLANSGIRFDRAYCQQAVCGASRLSLMSGLYPTMTGEQTFHVSNWRDRHPNVLTMNQHFGKQGYETIGLGKIYHGHTGAGVDPDNWNRWIDLSAPDYAKPENLNLLKEALASGKIGDARDPAKGPLTESADVHDNTYLDGMRAAKTVQLLGELSTEKNKPFFLAVGISKPHLPFSAPKKYWDLYERENFKMPPNQSIPEGYPPHAANLMAHEMHKYSDFEGEKPTDFSDELNLRLLHGYAAATSYADACVGRILDSLDKTGLSENTIVVLWGDHGWKLGDHATWVKHTNFECDTRAPLIIRDPRLASGQSTSRLVELIDLYPTLCELTGIPIPSHCQGRSFQKLITEPESGHRYDAYSSYPAGNLLGHSIRIKDYRYTQWRDESGEVKTSVLTQLKLDPGEETNLIDDPKHAEALAMAKERLDFRIKAARTANPESDASATTPVANSNPPINQIELSINLAPSKIRQTIDGFGGSIAFWGTRADEQALSTAIEGLGVNIIRAQGEVSKTGGDDRNRDVLQRAMKINPNLQVLLTFWQPKSATHPDPNYWLDVKTIGSNDQYVIKPSLKDAWADELVGRVKQYLQWGINVTTIGVQNETNWSHPGTQTCHWSPNDLREFIEQKIKPRLQSAGLENIKIAAPDLAYIGSEASEFARYLPVLTSPDVDVAAYHIYDSFMEGQAGSIKTLVDNTQKLNSLRTQYLPGKRLWMTETTGAQWNGDAWHTYGWTPTLTEHDKAIKAARYIHLTLVDAEANAFLWWGLVYSLAPDAVTNPNTRQKHRDEGLVLVREKNVDGFQPFLETTKTYYAFRQYSAFVKPGYRRIQFESPSNLQVSAFESPDRSKLVMVMINDTDQSQQITINQPGGFNFTGAWQTDKNRDCATVKLRSPIPAKAVRTLVFER